MKPKTFWLKRHSSNDGIYAYEEPRAYWPRFAMCSTTFEEVTGITVPVGPAQPFQLRPVKPARKAKAKGAKR